MVRIIILLFICYLSIYSSCNKRINCKDVIYSFETSIRVFPDSDSININDTIWLDFSSPTNLRDVMSGSMIDYSDAENFVINIRVFELTGGSINDPGGIGAVSDFEYKLVYGTYLPGIYLPNENRNYVFAQISNEYKFKLGFIPKKKGIFFIAPGDATNVHTKKNKCDKASFSITFANTNQHLYFYEQNRPGYTPSEYERTHMYCFKVK